MATLGDLAKKTRFLLRQYGARDVPDTSADVFSLYDALLEALNHYAIETACFEVSYDLDSTPDEAVYPFADFGTGSPKPGTRVFKPTYVGYDERDLDEVADTQLPPSWRFAASGTPRAWRRSGSRAVQLYPAPANVAAITLAGYAIPNPSTFDEIDDEPEINPEDCDLLPVYATYLCIVHDPNGDAAARGELLLPEWKAGVARAHERIHGMGGKNVIVGRYAGSGGRGLRTMEEITVLVP